MALWDTVIQIIILILALRALHMVTASESCSEVRRNFNSRVGSAKIPYVAYEAQDLRICPNHQLSCCNREMEDRFQTQSKKDLKKWLQMKTSGMKFNFRSFATNYQGDIIDTFLFSRNNTRDVVKRSLRKKIESEKVKASLQEVDQLYQSLGLQSTGKDVRRAFDRFADKLFLILMDEESTTSEQDPLFERCVVGQRMELHPFMDVPEISASNLTTAIELARTLHKSLAAGAVAVNVTEGARLSKSCQEALVKMQYCSFCPGFTLLKPCAGFCKNVLRGCFAGISELDQYWNHYISSLGNVAERMKSSESKYNLEIALEDFQNKLSSSLSVVLENITALRASVEKQCKTTRTLNRSKRNSDLPTGADELDDRNNKLAERSRGRDHIRRRRNRRRRTRNFDQMREGFNRALNQLEEEDPHVGMTSIEPSTRIRVDPALRIPPHEVLTQQSSHEKRILPRKSADRSIIVSKKQSSQLHKRIARFIDTLNSSINFYRHLPDDMCGKETGFGIEVSRDSNCWEGNEMVTEYQREVIPPGYGKQASNPEVKVLKVDKEIKMAIEGLRITTKTLLVSSGKTQIPEILLQAPVFARRENKKALAGLCDDEDDCYRREGSGTVEEFDLDSEEDDSKIPEKSLENDIKVIVDTTSEDNEFETIDTDISIDFAVEEEKVSKPNGGDKCKGGRRKCGRNKNKVPKEEHRTKVVVTSTRATTTSSAQAIVNFNLMLWFISIISSTLTLHVLV